MWRRVLQVCKSKKSVLRAGIFVLLAGLYIPAFAQTIDMPEMPDMPSMPTIDSSFYRPSFPTRPNASSSKKSSASSIKRTK